MDKYNELLAYCAGLIDGEGCITIGKRKPGSVSKYQKSPLYSLRVEINMTCPKPLFLFYELFGGRYPVIRKHINPKKPMWSWLVTSKLAEKALKKLLPYLTVKKEEALVALEFSGTMKNFQGKGITPKEESEKREAYKLKLSELKQRGYPMAMN